MRYRLTPTADGTDTLHHPHFDQTYHSRHGALAEARHVFLRASGVVDRLATGRPTRVLEVGFGTGLNALLTSMAAMKARTPLTFVSMEREVLPADTLAALNHAAILRVPTLKAPLLGWRRSLPEHVIPGVYEITLGHWALLRLIVGDATEAIVPTVSFDAVYHDAFSPDANPALWTSPFLRTLFVSLRPGGRLATYTAKGSVRRTMQAVGFEVEKRPGPPGKREMLVGHRP
ncbi:MAG: tRNA (5-methylaminomethyl-2-thiouridine)(34)-methyltransferase MnmD [Bacteroidota bacterium]